MGINFSSYSMSFISIHSQFLVKSHFSSSGVPNFGTKFNFKSLFRLVGTKAILREFFDITYGYDGQLKYVVMSCLLTIGYGIYVRFDKLQPCRYTGLSMFSISAN